MPHELVIPDPLGKVFQACESYCIAGCCQLDAYKLDSEWLLTCAQVLPDDIAIAARQLDEMIALVSAIGAAVEADPHFCYTWPTGAECAAYLAKWRELLSSAQSQPVRALDPEQRLATAGPRNSEPWNNALASLVMDAGILLEWKYRDRAVAMLRTILALDDGDPASPARKDFDKARQYLAYWD